jgi:hypothetical protein
MDTREHHRSFAEPNLPGYSSWPCGMFSLLQHAPKPMQNARCILRPQLFFNPQNEGSTTVHTYARRLALATPRDARRAAAVAELFNNNGGNLSPNPATRHARMQAQAA